MGTKRPASIRKVAYFYGCFANFYDPEIAKSSVSVLQKIGVDLTLPEQKCCGLPMMANGNFQGAEANAHYNIRVLSKLAEQGYDVITTCTTCSLTIKREYPNFFCSDKAKLVAEHSYTIEEYLMRFYHAGELNASFAELPMSVVYHSPCHMRAQLHAEGEDETLELLKLLPGLKISKITDTCCGMGGSYGLKTSSYKMSQEIGKHVFEEIRAAMPDKVVTDCGGCKLQIEAGTGFDVIHPILLVEKAFRKKISTNGKLTSLYASKMC